jgi:hypothetical protein
MKVVLGSLNSGVDVRNKGGLEDPWTLQKCIVKYICVPKYKEKVFMGKPESEKGRHKCIVVDQ